jgi:hypothetical protein
MKSCWLWLLTSIVLPVALLGAEKTIRLPEDNRMADLKVGAGVEVTRKDCVACHSTDYIVRQPGRDLQQWQAEVAKMVTVYGARISEPDSRMIANYLTSYYGPKQQPAREGSAPDHRATGKP